ncbi:MAG TPA: lipocalin family protein [Nevskia sp.]|nr:lipocalin family protein [Nevskia sp.]
MKRTAKQAVVQGAVAALLALALAACAGPAAAPQPLAVSAPVNAQKLGGQWYLIAHVPYAEERDQADASIELRPRDDGGFDEIYRYFDGGLMQSVARQRSRYEAVAGSGNARWIDRSRALDSQMELGVLYVDPAYRYAVVGESNRRLGWIYARDPAVDAGTYAMLVARLDQQGYDVSRLHRLGHSQVQVGQPSFGTPGAALN